jgi:hypothetical protein
MGSIATAVLIPGARQLMIVAIDDDAYRTLAVNLYDELLVSLALRSWIVGTVGLVLLVGALIVRTIKRPVLA